MSEPLAADKWIYDTLKADATLTALIGGATTPRISVDMATQGAPLPYIIFQMQAATDLMVLGANRVWSNMVYIVRGVAEAASYGGDLETIAERIDLALHRGAGSTAEGIVYTCVREAPFRLPEVTDGRQFRHSGGRYRIYAKAA